jgi:hypothetical protein
MIHRRHDALDSLGRGRLRPTATTVILRVTVRRYADVERNTLVIVRLSSRTLGRCQAARFEVCYPTSLHIQGLELH